MYTAMIWVVLWELPYRYDRVKKTKAEKKKLKNIRRIRAKRKAEKAAKRKGVSLRAQNENDRAEWSRLEHLQQIPKQKSLTLYNKLRVSHLEEKFSSSPNMNYRDVETGTLLLKATTDNGSSKPSLMTKTSLTNATSHLIDPNLVITEQDESEHDASPVIANHALSRRGSINNKFRPNNLLLSNSSSQTL